MCNARKKPASPQIQVQHTYRPRETEPELEPVLTQSQRVFSLPNELLVLIFHEFVDEDQYHSPVVLSHVCQLWRQLALLNSSLWTVIDLDSIQRARHHLAHSQQQPLIVSWLDSQSPRNQDDIQWIFSQASRFLRLTAVIDSFVANRILPQTRNELLLLQFLELTSRGVWSRCRLGSMPNLQVLSLS